LSRCGGTVGIWWFCQQIISCFFLFSFFVQHESEAYFLNRFIGTFYSIRDDPAALHLTLKEYACNVHVSVLLCPS
jgi:hypothetical protein